MIQINGQPIGITKFPDHTHLFKCNHYDLTKQAQLLNENEAVITWHYTDDSEIFQLQCAVDHLKRNGKTKITLIMPYTPNARMDRTKYEEMFTLKSFAKLINNMNFHKVITLDVHSNVSTALFDNMVNQSPKPYIKNTIKQLPNEPLTFFFPDEGSMKRYCDIALDFGHKFAFGMKNRDWRTGNIKSLQIIGETEEIKDHNILIIDDICSKGGTFYHSAKALKELGAKNIYLYVSHLENSVHHGNMIQSGLISHIYTTNSIYQPNLAPETTTTPITIVTK